jgi:alkanesulfonate monooxygenase SsuD/methylene tetrahydromethanopterin reductase-like flavin-dependent oxidoreductase (luciferase family)
VDICLMIEGQEGVTWEQWLALADACEAAGLEGLFRSDHYRSIVRGEPAGALDAWATLAALAARTERIRLGTMVSPVTFRPASVLAKNVVTVDHVSGGRVELGIGAGWYELEHDTYGFPFGSARDRVDELQRQLPEIIRQWTESDDIRPKPLQQPRPRIIVGGRAKPRTVALAVRFADEYNTVSPSVDEARERARVVADAARSAGREPLRFSMMIGCVVGRDAAEVDDRVARIGAVTTRHPEPPPIAGTVDDVVALLREYEAAGVGRAMLQHLHHEDVDMVALLGEVAAALRS